MAMKRSSGLLDLEPDSSDRTELARRIYFESPLAFASAFAGDTIKNVSRLSARLNVPVVSRDIWLAAQSDADPLAEERLMKCVQELKRLSCDLGRALEQSEFEFVVRSYEEGLDGDLQTYFGERIQIGNGKVQISPRSKNQLAYVRAMREKDLVFGVGPAGTGKTFLAMCMAISYLLENKVRRIVLTRPAVEAGENLGYLPGTLQEKINPYLRPLLDAMHEVLNVNQVEDLITRNIIEVAPLAFMRGRTISHSFVILDEAQNTTCEQMLMFLTRLGFYSHCVVCGDPSQIDLGNRQSGLLQALTNLGDVPEIEICKFDAGDVVRHPLVESIIRAYRKHEVR